MSSLSFFDPTLEFNKYRIRVGSTVVIKDLKTEPLASNLNGKRGTVRTRNSRDRWIVTLLEPHGELPEVALQDKNVELAAVYDKRDKATAAYERAREEALANPAPNPRMKHWDKVTEAQQEKFAVTTALRKAKQANAAAQRLLDQAEHEMQIAQIYVDVDDDDARMQKAHDMMAVAIEAMTTADEPFEALRDVNGLAALAATQLQTCVPRWPG